MKAAVVDAPGEPSYGDFAAPQPSASGDVVQVLAAALTNLDVATAEGRHYLRSEHYPAVVGKECVARAPDGTRRFYAANTILPPFGSMAELTHVLVGSGLPVPDGIADEVAAALGNAGLAAWLPLSWRGRMRPGESVLVMGATGNSGRLAVTAARRLGAGTVVAAGRNEAALQEARGLGADATVHLLPNVNIAAALREAAGGEIDVVVDYLCGPYVEAVLSAMAVGGRMVQVGSIAGPAVVAPAQTLRRGSLDVLGFAYYHAPAAEQAAAYRELCRHALSGALSIGVTVLPLQQIGTAWREQKAGTATRLVLRP